MDLLSHSTPVDVSLIALTTSTDERVILVVNTPMCIPNGVTHQKILRLIKNLPIVLFSCLFLIILLLDTPIQSRDPGN